MMLYQQITVQQFVSASAIVRKYKDQGDRLLNLKRLLGQGYDQFEIIGQELMKCKPRKVIEVNGRKYRFRLDARNLHYKGKAKIEAALKKAGEDHHVLHDSIPDLLDFLLEEKLPLFLRLRGHKPASGIQRMTDILSMKMADVYAGMQFFPKVVSHKEVLGATVNADINKARKIITKEIKELQKQIK